MHVYNKKRKNFAFVAHGTTILFLGMNAYRVICGRITCFVHPFVTSIASPHLIHHSHKESGQERKANTPQKGGCLCQLLDECRGVLVTEVWAQARSMKHSETCLST